MTVRNLRTIASLDAVALLFLFLLISSSARAQETTSSGPGAFISRPSIGLQTIFFGKNSPQATSISPGDDRDVLGGGFSSANNALRVVVELIPDANGMWRIPLSFEAYQFVGKTTFAVRFDSARTGRWLFRHNATMLSVGTGVTAAFFSKPNLYVNLEGKLNYLPPATFYNRQYIPASNQTVAEKEVELQDEARTRIGGYLRIGTQVDFFDPLMLDFSFGAGIINAFGKETDPAASHHLLTIDPRNATEGPVGYVGFGLSVIWEL